MKQAEIPRKMGMPRRAKPEAFIDAVGTKRPIQKCVSGAEQIGVLNAKEQFWLPIDSQTQAKRQLEMLISVTASAEPNWLEDYRSESFRKQ